jgi:hypothetical protein
MRATRSAEACTNGEDTATCPACPHRSTARSARNELPVHEPRCSAVAHHREDWGGDPLTDRPDSACPTQASQQAGALAVAAVKRRQGHRRHEQRRVPEHDGTDIDEDESGQQHGDGNRPCDAQPDTHPPSGPAGRRLRAPSSSEHAHTEGDRAHQKLPRRARDHRPVHCRQLVSRQPLPDYLRPPAHEQ